MRPHRVLNGEADYPRWPHLEFYRSYPNPFWSVTFELDATAARAAARRHEVSTYATLVYAFHRALVSIDAFRVRLLVDGQLVRFSTLRIGMTVPAPRGTFSFSEIDWPQRDGETIAPDFAAFHRAASASIAHASAGIKLTGGEDPDFAYYTALPAVPFSSFTHAPLPDPTAGQPEVAFGRFREDAAGRSWVPVGLQVNHLYIDGAAVGELVQAAERSFTQEQLA